jgi:amino acid permease
MPTTYKVLGQLASTATTAETLYTVPSSTSTVVSTITLANISASAITYRLAIRPAGATLENKHYIAYGVSLAANDTTTLTLGLTLATTDVITVYASAGSALVTNAYGAEITA